MHSLRACIPLLTASEKNRVDSMKNFLNKISVLKKYPAITEVLRRALTTEAILEDLFGSTLPIGEGRDSAHKD